MAAAQLKKSNAHIRQEAHALVDQMKAGATWDDLAYAMEVRADIEAGLADIEAGRVYTTEEVRKVLGL